MNNRNSQNGSSLGMLLKIVGVLYLTFFGYGFVKEYVFTRTDSQSHTTGIIVGIVCLVILIPLLISTVKGIESLPDDFGVAVMIWLTAAADTSAGTRHDFN